MERSVCCGYQAPNSLFIFGGFGTPAPSTLIVIGVPTSVEAPFIRKRHMKHNLTHNRHLQICAALIVADCLVFTVVNPRQASAPWLIVGYLLLGMTFFGLAGLLASSLKGYGERTQKLGRRFLRYGAAIVAALIGLQSIGQLTVKDIATLLPLALIVYFYLGYGKTYGKRATPE